MKINIDIVNDVIYKHEFFYYEIHCIVVYKKIIKFGENVDLKIYLLRSTRLLFLWIPKYKVFEHEFLQVCGTNSCEKYTYLGLHVCYF
jgi:hypothetical protein